MNAAKRQEMIKQKANDMMTKIVNAKKLTPRTDKGSHTVFCLCCMIADLQITVEDLNRKLKED